MKNTNLARNGFVYLLILVALGAIAFFNFSSSQKKLPEVSLNALAQDIVAAKVKKITIQGDDLAVEYYQDIPKAQSRKEDNVDFIEAMRNLGVTQAELGAVVIEVQDPGEWTNWLGLLGSLLPLVLFAGVLFFMMRQAQSGNNQALMFGRSRARMFSGDRPTVTFADVAGVEEAKAELREVVEFLKEPEKFAALGARIPKGVLLVGPPGTGKTLLGRAVAGEAGVPFFSISGSEFVEMFVGVGASRVRDLFDQAKRNAPCIVFVDEIDAVGRHRGAGLGGSHDEREQTLNQILVEMDGFDTDTSVIVLAATNRPDILDPALLRPGRFDRRVILDRPDLNGRKAILEVHVKGKPLAPEIDLTIVAQQTPGFTGADIENLVNEAAILAARRNKKAIGLAEFQEAIERVMAGPERKSRLISPEEKEILAHHEAGHALVRKMLPLCDPVTKISIVSRGTMLGYVLHAPENDQHLMSRAKFEDEIAATLGGRVAEELIFTDVTSSAVDDLEHATQMARAMVTQYGMSDKLGPMTFGKREELIFLGREIAEHRNYSDETAEQIDEEVKRIVDAAYARARDIQTTHKSKLVELARRLIDKETLDRAEFEAMLA